MGIYCTRNWVYDYSAKPYVTHEESIRALHGQQSPHRRIGSSHRPPHLPESAPGVLRPGGVSTPSSQCSTSCKVLLQEIHQMSFLLNIFTVYIFTALLVDGTILADGRAYARELGWFSFRGKCVFDCRMCTGFWISLIVALIYQYPPIQFFALWGMSYWLAAVEK
jgi:hypothetical protein